MTVKGIFVICQSAHVQSPPFARSSLSVASVGVVWCEPPRLIPLRDAYQSIHVSVRVMEALVGLHSDASRSRRQSTHLLATLTDGRGKGGAVRTLYIGLPSIYNVPVWQRHLVILSFQERHTTWVYTHTHTRV